MNVSWLGLLVSLAVLTPSLLLVPGSARGHLPEVRIPWALRALERIGQAGCLLAPALASQSPGSPTWAVLAAVLLAGYLLLWLRWLRHDRDVAQLFRPLLGVPVPMAVLPVLIFLSTAVWLGSPMTALAATLLGLGHVPTSRLTGRAVLRAAPDEAAA